MYDHFGRKINYLRLSVTDRCNFNCQYCKPDQTPFYQPEHLLTDDEIIEIVEAASKMGVDKIRLTGGEPLMRKGITNLVSKISGISGVQEVVMTSNASLLLHKLDELKQAGLSRVNISLDSLDGDKFKLITKGGNLDSVFKSIDRLLELGMKPVKVNVVLMKGINDDEIIDFINLTKDREIIVRFIELMPIGNESFSYNKYYLSNDEILEKCKELKEVRSNGNETAKYFKLPGSLGKVGLISAISQHFCSTCNRIRLTSDGKVKTCLHGTKEYDLLSFVRNQRGNIQDFLKDCINKKPKSHKINQKGFEQVKRSMYQIGG